MEALETWIWRQIHVGNAENALRGTPVSSSEPIEYCLAGRILGNGRRWGRAAFERPLPYVQLTEPNARTVATAV